MINLPGYISILRIFAKNGQSNLVLVLVLKSKGPYYGIIFAFAVQYSVLVEHLLENMIILTIIIILIILLFSLF